jgi:hypothetical protein
MVLRFQTSSVKWLKAILLLQVLLILGACPRVWHFSVTDTRDMSHPRLCFSRFENCVGHGVSDGFLEIEEVDQNGKILRSMWQIERVGDERLNEVTYGIVPKGYKEVMKAKPLELGKWYCVENTYYFRLSKSGDQGRAEVTNFEGFSRKMKEERGKGRPEQ